MMIKFNSELNYKRVKELRTSKSISQQEMANILNITRQAYSQCEGMKSKTFSIIRLNEIANCFNVSLNYLLNLDDNSKILNTKNELNPTIAGQRLKEIRLENKYYQDTLAQETGVTNALICEYEKGKRLISLPVAFYVCHKFNISVDWLYGKIDSPKYLNHK